DQSVPFVVSWIPPLDGFEALSQFRGKTIVPFVAFGAWVASGALGWNCSVDNPGPPVPVLSDVRGDAVPTLGSNSRVGSSDPPVPILSDVVRDSVHTLGSDPGIYGPDPPVLVGPDVWHDELVDTPVEAFNEVVDTFVEVIERLRPCGADLGGVDGPKPLIHLYPGVEVRLIGDFRPLV